MRNTGLSYIKNVENFSVFLQISGGLAKLFEIKEVQAEIEEIKSILDEVQGEGKEDEKGDKVFLRTLKDKNENYIFPPNSIGEISAWGYKILESSVIPNSNSCCAKGSSCDKTAESILRVADSFVVKVLDPCSSAGLPIHPCLPKKTGF